MSQTSTIKKVIPEKNICFLEDNIFCHGSKIQDYGGYDINEIEQGMYIEYEERNGQKGPEVARIISIFALPKDFLINDFSSGGSIAPSLISQEGNNSVKSLACYMSKTKLTATQLRNFYDEVLNYQNMSFPDIHNRLQMLLAKIAYAVWRGNVPQAFLEMMQNRIQCIETKQDFDYFLQHLEAFVAWFRYYNPK